MIVLLLINDHILRIYWPSWWTGKLGDLTWLAFAPLIVAIPFAIFFSRKTDAQSKAFGLSIVIATGAVFSAIKVLPAAHAAFEIAFEALVGWKPSVGVDPTDLLTLPGLLIALSIWNRNRAKRPALKRLPVVRGLLLVALGSFASIATTPAPPCDWEVSEGESRRIEAAVREHPFVEVLSDDFLLREIDADCWVNDSVDVNVLFDLPPEYTSLDIRSFTPIKMTYSEDGSIEVVIPGQQEDVITATDLITSMRDAIQQIERDERLVDASEKLGLVKEQLIGEVRLNRIRYESGIQVNPSSPYGYISMLYIWDTDTSSWELMDYQVPTHIEWTAFPELERAKVLAATRIRDDMEPGCSIIPDDLARANRARITDAWTVHIHIECDDIMESLRFDMADEAP